MKPHKFFSCYLVVSILCSIHCVANSGFGHASLLNDGWFFTLNQPEAISADQLKEDRAVWQTIDLPHDWSVKGELSPDFASCIETTAFFFDSAT